MDEHNAIKNNKYINKKSIKEFLLISLGILLVAIGIHVFKNPNKFALGGVSGLSIVLGYYFPQAPVGGLMMAMNILLLVCAFFFLGKNSAIKSIYGSFALSGAVMLMEVIFPIKEPVTQQKLLELLFGVFLPGIGGGIVFSYGATTGGTDIVAKILSKYFHAKVSISLLITDFSIAFYAGILYGVEIFLFSILGVCLKVFVMDSLMENLQVNKIIVVISEKSDTIKQFICEDLVRGATVHIARGAFTIEEKEVITTVLSRSQAKRLQIYIREVDPGAFITISNSSRIIGKGFNRFD